MTNRYDNFLKRKITNEALMMQIAIGAAEEAKSRGDLPIGALLLFKNGKYIVDNDTTYTERDHTNHAEMNVMRKASQMMFPHKSGTILFCSVEPCAMCVAAALENGITEIVFGAYDLEKGFSTRKTLNLDSVSHIGGVLAKECREILPLRLKETTCEIINESTPDTGD